MWAHKPLSKAVVTLCTLAATLAVLCVPAGAEVTHKYLSSITEVPAQGPKGEAVAVPGLLDETSSMTIDDGDLYVAEDLSLADKSRVVSPARTDVFDTATHAFVKQFDEAALPAEELYRGIAVGHATGSTQTYVGALERLKNGELYGVVVPFDAEGHQLGQPWRGTDTPTGAFSGNELPGGEPEALVIDVAVDNDSTSLLGDWAAGDVFVATAKRSGQSPGDNVVDILKPEAGGTENYQTQLTGTCESPGVCPGKVIPFVSPGKIAVNPRNGDLLVVDRGEGSNNVVDMFKPGPLADEYEFVGVLKESPQGAFGNINAIAIDGGEGPFAEGEFYVVTPAGIYQFSPAGQYAGRFPAPPNLQSAAVDPATHDLYLGSAQPEEEASQVELYGPSLLLPDVTTAPVSSLAPESATLNGTVNPDKAGAGATTCQFVWGTSESFGQVDPCTAPVAEGESPVSVSAHLEGLEPGKTYYYRLQASNGNGVNEGEASQTLHFTTRGPDLAEESALDISSTSATLGANIDPRGSNTSYYFEYGLTSAYGTDIPAAPGESIGSSEGAVEVERHLQGLAPSATYHYRVVVTSDLEVEPGVFKETVFDGDDQTFTAEPTGGSLTLPDGRAWEQVSPVNKHGGNIFPPQVGTHVIQSSDSGDAMTYGAFGPTEAAVSGYAFGMQVLSVRGSNGWSSQDLALFHRTAAGLADNGFHFFSGDLSLALVEPPPFAQFTSLTPEVSPQDSEPTPYIRHNDTCGVQPSTCYLPLVTGASGYADVPPGTDFGYTVEAGKPVVNSVFGEATTDLSHVVFSSNVALTREPIGNEALYEWSAGKPPSEELQLVTGEAVSRDHMRAFPSNGRDALSSDGSRVIFETLAGSTDSWHLNQRDMMLGQTVRLDEVQPGASGAGSPGAVFQAASSDGTVVYFTDWQQLTVGSGANAHRQEADLYECRMQETAGKEECSLTDLTPETGGQKADVEPTILGASEDGADVYFAATGVLTNQPSSSGERAVAGAPNLYESHDGTIKLIGVLSSGDSGDWGGSNDRFELPLFMHTARVSPDGRYLAFMSNRSLTGYDNVDVSIGEPDQEVFLFDSATERIICASCDPSGARPEGGGVAANIPGWDPYRNNFTVYQPRYLSNSGRLFFNSVNALVPQDINKQKDVYEYEPVGIGNCSASLPTYEVAVDGCVSLISSGTSKTESTFMDASDDGNDVFFLTGEKLVGSDVDSALDLYDARVCSTAAPCPSAVSSPPPCTTADSCRSAPSPQPAIFGSPASATFTGAGNVTSGSTVAAKSKSKSLTRAQKLARALKVCRREAKRKRATCERKARKQYSSKPAHRARVTKGGRG